MVKCENIDQKYVHIYIYMGGSSTTFETTRDVRSAVNRAGRLDRR